ncbi:hypothetical protein [Deinococcus sp. S9]|uniref:hypothetical protein n=1 Tax=Deinococcus sp. S9 TaxID=2545754 RepID=UPI00105605A8|nr:hypothetical protein [Deinococcus sp. S9]TDE85305.1 hypothetical protein E0686_12275 [Deinococcus sp. S9]
MKAITSVSLDLSYSAAQAAAFFDNGGAKYNIIPKGRRSGFTQGGMQAAVEWALEGLPVLWGDTINANIRKYVERYALPPLKKQGVPHEWHIQDKTLRFPSGGFIDFRSADNPENWEGFGYKKVLLNEAGIILQGQNGRYLYQNSVMPMLLDYPDSELFAFGVPKGTADLYFELEQRARAGQAGYITRTFTSFDTPFLQRADIEALVEEMRSLGGQLLVDQEIFGKFVNLQGDGLRVIPEVWVRAAFARWEERQQPGGFPDAVGVDVARGGKDKTVFAQRWGTYVGQIVTHPGASTPDGPSVRALLMPHLSEATRVNIDIVGVGSSPFDFVRQVHEQTYAVNGGLQGIEGTDRTGNYEFANLRAKLYWQLREALDPVTGLDLALPPDEELLIDLTSVGWQPRGNKIIVEPKKDIQKRLGRSPDKGDAVTYAFYEPPEPTGGFFIDTI